MLSNTNINRVLLKRGNVLTQIADTLNSIEKPNDEEKARIHPSELRDIETEVQEIIKNSCSHSQI